MKHVFIIHVSKKTPKIEKMISQVMADYDYEIIHSQYPGHASEIIAQANEKTRFYSVGGDGMVNQLVNGLVHTSHELVILPLGTGNDLARILYQTKDVKKILVDSLNKTSRDVDVIAINDRYYINSACFGIDSVIANSVHNKSHLKMVNDRYGYIMGILKNVKGYDFPCVKVIVNDQVVYDDQVTLCAMMNGVYYGGGFPIAPYAQLDDGMIDVVILKKISKLKAPYYVSLILHKKLFTHPDVTSFKTSSFIVETKAPSNLDGDEYQSQRYEFALIQRGVHLVY